MPATGEIDGLGWFEVPKSLFTYPQGFAGDQDASVVTVLCPLDKMPDQAALDRLDSDPSWLAYRYHRSVGMLLVDAGRQLPGRLVAYDKYAFVGFDFLAWLAERVEIPAGIDLRIDVDIYRDKAAAIARTLKRGAVVDVRRKLSPYQVLAEQIGPILGYFSRNCPRVEGDAPALSWGAHVAKLLAHVDASGRAQIDEWTRGRMLEPLRLSGASLPGAGVDLLKLRKASGSNAILAEASIAGGHEMLDDDSGTSVVLALPLPETVAQGLKGERLGKVVDVDWLADMTIRTATVPDGRVRIRAYGNGVPFDLPAATTDDPAATAALLDGLVGSGPGRHGEWMEIDSTATALLSRQTPATAGAIVAALAVEEEVDLRIHGLPGWRLKRNGRTILVQECPSEPLAGWLSTLKDRLKEASS